PIRDSGEDIDALLNSVVQAILFSVRTLTVDRDGLLAEWRALDYLQGRMLEYDGHDRVVPATGVGLAGDGRYVIRDHNGVEHSILAGDLNPIKLTS
ncbi:MAG: hypothetical protein JRF04_04665, partial [Deltaproteobacteria bacterium]|nr:hypothetical protein [Deltaproteobacteria bacterium]